MKRTLALLVLAVLPMSAFAIPIQYGFEMGPSDITEGGTGSFFWDTDTHSISNLNWDFGNGRIGSVDDALVGWSQPTAGGTLAEFVFDIFTSSGVHPAHCGDGTGCVESFGILTGLQGFPGPDPLTVMGFGLGSLGERTYGFRLQDQVSHEGFLSVATPVTTPEPATLSLMAVGLAGVLLSRRRRLV